MSRNRSLGSAASGPGASPSLLLSLSLVVASLVACAGCLPSEGDDDDRDSGTAVGNPGVTSFAIAVADDELELVDARVVASPLELSSCSSGDVQTITVTEELDLLTSTPVDVPAGQWCWMRLALNGPLLIDGEGFAGGASFHLELTLQSLTLAAVATVEVDESDLVWELASPGWLTAELLDLSDGDDIDVDDQDDRHHAIATALLESSALWDDPDADGRIDANERDEGPLARFGSFEVSDAPAGLTSDSEVAGGCGCGSGGADARKAGPGAVVAGLGLMLLGRRRRVRRAGRDEAAR